MARPASFSTSRRRQDLHVAGEHDEVDRLVVDQRGELRLLRVLGRRRHRQIDVGQPLPLDPPAHGLVVGDDRDQLHRQDADGVAVEKVVEAVAEVGDEDQHPRLDREVVERPVEGEARRDRREAGAVSRRRRRAAGAEKATRMKKRSVSGSPYWALSTMLPSCDGDRSRHRRDDAGPVVAGKRQDKSCRLGGHRGAGPGERDWRARRPTTARRRRPQPASRLMRIGKPPWRVLRPARHLSGNDRMATGGARTVRLPSLRATPPRRGPRRRG